MSTELNESPTPESFAWQSIVDLKNKYLGEVTSERVLHVWSQSQRLRAGLFAIGIAIAADFLWLQPDGYSGFAAFLLLAFSALAIEIYVAREFKLPTSFSWSLLAPAATAIAMFVACLRMIWQGNIVIAFIAVVLISIFCLVSREESVGILRGLSSLFRAIFDGVVSWVKLLTNFPTIQHSSRRINWVSWIVPVVVGLVFLYPLLSAHPDLLVVLWSYYRTMMESIFEWFSNWSLSRLFLLVAIATIAFGLLVPTRRLFIRWVVRDHQTIEPCTYSLYQTYRNCLVTVIAVFAVFLAVEFSTLWLQAIPRDFHYAAYAHQGAAWLVIALMMSTITMCIIFNSAVHAHPKYRLLSKLAWIWFAANILLVVAVYHRLGIYVSFNGLTRLRIVGYVGVTCVLAGFVMVMYRVTHLRSVLWLVHHQAWAFFISIFALAVLPMDWIANQWNVACVEKGDYAPISHFLLQPISPEGLIALAPLLDSADPIVKDGIAALFAKKMDLSANTRFSDRRIAHAANIDGANEKQNWRGFQWSEYHLEQILSRHEPYIKHFLNLKGLRENAMEQLQILATKSN